MTRNMKRHIKIPVLPTDVVLEILSRVPARAVGRFRTVSKLYHRLLSEPSFIKDHLRRGGGITSSKLIVHLLDLHGSTKTNSYYCYPLDNSNLTDDADLNDSSNEIVGNNIVSGVLSCNGLLCIINRGDDDIDLLTLWNPTTREVTSLPRLKQDTDIYESMKSCTTRCLYYYFFGHDSLNDDYKIVCVACLVERVNTLPACVITPISNTTYIYSHRIGCWKEIEQALIPPYCIQSDNCNFVHGKVHWVACSYLNKEVGKGSQFIVSFDLATERFGTVPRPRSDHPGHDLSVCAFGGELCFYINCDCLAGRGFEMWMMREYGVEQSWFQLLSIPLHNLQYSQSTFDLRSCVPLFQMKSGEILLEASEDSAFRTSIYLYNPKNYKFLTVKTGCGNTYVSGHVYVESLVETAISNQGQSCSVRHSPQSHLQDKD